MAITWRKGTDYPDVESLSEAYREKRSELTRNLLLYWMVIIIIAGVVFFLAPSFEVVGAGVIALIVAFGYVYIRRRGYTKVAEIITSGEFFWTAGKIQNMWKRGMIDISSGNAYQVGMHDEWVECDVSTYNACIIGKEMALVRKSLEPKDCAYGVLIPEGGSFKQVKKIARTK